MAMSEKPAMIEAKNPMLLVFDTESKLLQLPHLGRVYSERFVRRRGLVFIVAAELRFRNRMEEPADRNDRKSNLVEVMAELRGDPYHRDLYQEFPLDDRSD